MAQAIASYFKNTLRQSLSQKHGIRFPIEASIALRVYRMDEKILSFRLDAAARIRAQTLYEKHLYFLYTECGARPLFKREAVKGKCRCLYIEGNTATDPLTDKHYPIKKKFRI
jgi:hypothetical protein